MRFVGSKVKGFGREETGSALVFVTIMLPVLVGFALLAIDMARVNNLHNDLQSGVDALALAGAAELDGNADAWTRAERAMATLVQNTANFSSAGSITLTAGQPGGTANCNSAGNISWCFLKDIPASDTDPITSTNYAATPEATHFVQVKSSPAGFDTIFPAAFLPGGGSDSFNVGAEAVAGFGSGVCDFTPLFICNPYEDPTQTGGVTLAQAVSEPEYRRRQILMRSGGGNAAYSPGNFGFLTPPTGNGARALAQAIASSTPNACYSSEGVTTKTGQQVGPVLAGLNLRFAINEPGISFSGSEYGPAVNVRKGMLPNGGNGNGGGGGGGNNCPNGNNITYSADPIADGVMGLPRDDCFASGTCSMMGGRMGGGDWDLTDYWAINHGGSVPADLWDGTEENKPTRYQVYLYEIEHQLIADVSTGGETGTPQSGCGTPVPMSTVDRRLIYGAILNCQALSATYNLGGHDENLPVEAFGSFFLTEPIKNNTDIYAELVDVTGRFGQGSLQKFQRDEAQLYR